MTEPEAPQSVPENAPDQPAALGEGPGPEAEAEPPPEPWTPERVSEWNAYYDLYVLAATVLLALVVACNYVTDSQLFAHLRIGQSISEKSAPVLTDELSYTETGKRWVNVPWLFQWAQAALYKLVYGLVPTDPTDPTANRVKADQIAIRALALLDALLRLATAWVLLKVRHRGPGLWWCAVCVVLALGAVLMPEPVIGPSGVSLQPGLALGGIAGVPSIGPSSAGLLFLALELLVLFRAFGQGRGAGLWLLIPLFLLWANWDVSFWVGLLVLAAAALGRWLDGGSAAYLVAADRTDRRDAQSDNRESPEAIRPVSAATGFIVLALCAAVCLVNPSTYETYLTALRPFAQLFQDTGDIRTADQRSFFGSLLREQFPLDWYLLTAYYLIVVGVGLASFLVNSNRFAWSRFLPFVAGAVLWGIFMRFGADFALILAVVLALNGQEWYHARFGTEGRLGRLWSLWSTGGRLVTLALIFLMIGLDITGWEITTPGSRFGLGYEPDDFPIAAVEFLDRQNDIKGNILNTSMAQGDILMWKAGPKRKTYVDSRGRSLFPLDLLQQWHKTRKAISDDDMEAWKPLLDQYQISVVMIEPAGSPLTYNRLIQSQNWIPFYRDGRIVLFGRKDAAPSDVAVFKTNRLEPEWLAYHTSRPVPPAQGPPAASSWFDRIFQNNAASRPRTRTESARQWLTGTGDSQDLIEPARCLLAIQDARTALSDSPDDWIAFRRLNDAYRLLMIRETALLAGIPLTPENRNRIAALNPTPQTLMSRYRQRVTALNYAIQTTPPPRSAPARRELVDLNLELFQLYLAANVIDLARDRLAAALDMTEPDDLLPEIRTQLSNQLNTLNQATKQVEDKLDDLMIENQSGPADLGAYAQGQGAIGLAISKYADAERNGIALTVVKPRLIDLYCYTGQPDKALDLLGVGAVEDPNLGSEPGAAAYRQGLVYLLLGNYLSTASLWQDRAIPRVRYDRSMRVLSAGQALTQGGAIAATNNFVTLPATLTQQATWEYELAICQLESGLPDAAAEHFTKALTLDPALALRPIAAYYLERLGKPVPPAPKRDGEPVSKPSPLAGGPASPAPTVPGVAATPSRPAPGAAPNTAATEAGAASREPEPPAAQSKPAAKPETTKRAP
jgi:tetratricopeptide (TPR) repeat protein